MKYNAIYTLAFLSTCTIVLAQASDYSDAQKELYQVARAFSHVHKKKKESPPIPPSIPIIDWIYKNTPPLHESAHARNRTEHFQELEVDRLVDSRIERLMKRHAYRNYLRPITCYQYLAGTTGGTQTKGMHSIHPMGFDVSDIRTQKSHELNDNLSDTTQFAVMSDFLELSDVGLENTHKDSEAPSTSKYNLEKMD
jgi:hypothetical protein